MKRIVLAFIALTVILAGITTTFANEDNNPKYTLIVKSIYRESLNDLVIRVLVKDFDPQEKNGLSFSQEKNVFVGLIYSFDENIPMGIYNPFYTVNGIGEYEFGFCDFFWEEAPESGFSYVTLKAGIILEDDTEWYSQEFKIDSEN